MFNKRVASPTGEQVPVLSIAAPKLHFADATDFDDPSAGSDEEYTVATEEWVDSQMAHFHALQGSAEELDKQLAMFHADIAATPRGRAAQTHASPSAGRAGDRDGL